MGPARQPCFVAMDNSMSIPLVEGSYPDLDMPLAPISYIPSAPAWPPASFDFEQGGLVSKFDEHSNCLPTPCERFNALPNHIQARAEEELNETEEKRQVQLPLFRAKVLATATLESSEAVQHVLVRWGSDDRRLLAFLRARAWDQDAALKGIRAFAKHQTEVQTTDDLELKERVLSALGVADLLANPCRTTTGELIIYVGNPAGFAGLAAAVGDMPPLVISGILLEHLEAISIATDTTQICGTVLVWDMQSVSMEGIAACDKKNRDKKKHDKQDEAFFKDGGVPMRLSKCWAINVPWYVKTLHSIGRRFCSQLREMSTVGKGSCVLDFAQEHLAGDVSRLPVGLRQYLSAQQAQV